MRVMDDGTIRARAKEIPDVIPLRLNEQWKDILAEDKDLLEQTKDSTALKQLAYIGHLAIHDDLIGNIMVSLFENKRKNKRLGIIDFE